MIDWIHVGNNANPGYTKRTGYTEKDPLNKIVMDIYADCLGRAKVVSHTKQSTDRFIILPNGLDGYDIIYFVSKKSNFGYHFIRKDKNIFNGSRQG